MTVNGINGVNSQAGQIGMNYSMDSYSKDIQRQIANAQKELQELSSNEEMSMEEKMKKRQEIQQRINDLNTQLRQHQMELRREKQTKGTSMDDMLGGIRKERSAKSDSKSGGKGISRQGINTSTMQAMISADGSVEIAKAQGSVATGLEGKARVLKGEIEQDSGRGADVEKKKEELAGLEQKAQDATASQISSLADANKAMKEASQTDNTAQKPDGKADRAGNDKPENARMESGEVENNKIKGTDKSKTDGNASNADNQNILHTDGVIDQAVSVADGKSIPEQEAVYTSVNILL